MALDPMTGGMANRDAARRRAELLFQLRTLADTGRGVQALPLLLDACMRDKAILRIHVWMVDQAIFGSKRHVALRHVRQAADWCGHAVDNTARTDMGWLLDERTGGARWSAWLLAVGLDMGFKPETPNPYR